MVKIPLESLKAPWNHHFFTVKSNRAFPPTHWPWRAGPKAVTDNGASSSCSRCGARVSEEAVAELPIDDEVVNWGWHGIVLPSGKLT